MEHFSNGKTSINLEPKLVIGLMSGTSMDGIDSALVSIIPEEKQFYFDSLYPGVKANCIASVVYPFPDEFKKKLNNLVENKTISLVELCKMNFLLGEFFAEACFELIKTTDIQLKDVDIIGSHGQTIYHLPDNEQQYGYPIKSTLQIGEPSIIAERTGVTTIADFRPGDIAAGGEGAPLVSYADVLMFFNPDKVVLVQNIGGISNVTVLPGCDAPYAFDNGPGNILINLVTQKYFDREYDESGKIARSGIIYDVWVDNVLADDSYFSLIPPKTTGRETYNNEYISKILDKFPLDQSVDIVANFTALTAKCIANSYKDFILKKYSPSYTIIGGGGAYNSYLLELIATYLGDSIDVKTHEDFGISNKFKEAIAFALLAYTSYYNIPNNVPSCTGAKRGVVLGKTIKAYR